MEHDWITLRDIDEIYFPEICCATGVETEEYYTFYVYNDSLLWKILWLLRMHQYIELDVPMSEDAQRAIKRSWWRAVLKGAAIGGVLGVVGFLVGLTLSVQATEEAQRTLGTIIAGLSFVLAPIAGAMIAVFRAESGFMPAFFKLKGAELRARFKNPGFRQAFLELNQDLIAR